MYDNKKGKGTAVCAGLMVFATLLGGCVNTADTTNKTESSAPVNVAAPVSIPTIYVAQVTAIPTGNVNNNANAVVSMAPQMTVYNMATRTPAQMVTPQVIQKTAAPTTIVRTNAPTATPAPKSLKLGAKGDAVKLVQQKLIKLGFLKGKADGDFGAATEQAVKDFQKQYKLTVDGKVGDATLKKLNAAKATKIPTKTATPKAKKTATPKAKKTATPKPKKTATPTPKRTATPKPTATPKAATYQNTYLKKGATGDKVKRMQERLISLGYLKGTPTGRYDDITERAVVAFQKRNCSYNDGVAGPLTLSAMYSSKAKKAASSSGYIGIKFKKGDSGDEIKEIQKRLKTLGYFSGEADGKFGDDTMVAVRQFQLKNGLTVNGIVDDKTMDSLNSKDALKYSATKKP